MKESSVLVGKKHQISHLQNQTWCRLIELFHIIFQNNDKRTLHSAIKFKPYFAVYLLLWIFSTKTRLVLASFLEVGSSYYKKDISKNTSRLHFHSRKGKNWIYRRTGVSAVDHYNISGFFNTLDLCRWIREQVLIFKIFWDWQSITYVLISNVEEGDRG